MKGTIIQIMINSSICSRLQLIVLNSRLIFHVKLFISLKYGMQGSLFEKKHPTILPIPTILSSG